MSKGVSLIWQTKYSSKYECRGMGEAVSTRLCGLHTFCSQSAARESKNDLFTCASEVTLRRRIRHSETKSLAESRIDKNGVVNGLGGCGQGHALEAAVPESGVSVISTQQRWQLSQPHDHHVAHCHQQPGPPSRFRHFCHLPCKRSNICQ